MLFPTNVSQRAKHQPTACTLTATDPQTGLTICTNEFVTLLNNNASTTYRIYQITFSGARALNYELFCNIGVRQLIQAHLGSSQVIPTYETCSGNIEFAYSGITTDTLASIIYGTTTPTMATDTPYVITRQDENGQLSYETNPILNQIGITVWFLIAFALIAIVAKFIESRKT